MTYADMKLFRFDIHRNQSRTICMSFETSNTYYNMNGTLVASYTDFLLDFPIVDDKKKTSHIQMYLSSTDTSLLFNVTSNYRREYFLSSFYHLTFLHRYIYRSCTQIRLHMIKYQLFSWYALIDYQDNSTLIRFSNGSLHLPTLFVRKPLYWSFNNDSSWFIQIFHWANLTRTSTAMHLNSPFGLRISSINDLFTRISIDIEQHVFDQRLQWRLTIDHHWTVSLTIDRFIRYELMSIGSDSLLRLTRINLRNNQTHYLTLSYSTDNETLLHVQISFAKYFSTFINDFILDVSLRNRTLKCLCHLPFFKREFISFVWQRHMTSNFGYFHGSVQMNLLRRRRLIDYDYQWDLGSLTYWSLHSRLTVLSLNPIVWTWNFTNDYLWSGQWNIDFRLLLANHRELIRIYHYYRNNRLLSSIIFDIHLMNKHYYVNVNYSHLNHSIHGNFIRNNNQYPLYGIWSTKNSCLQLNTTDIISTTWFTSTSMKILVQTNEQKLGFLIESTNRQSTDDTDIDQVENNI
jgi:hypothetical protein